MNHQNDKSAHYRIVPLVVACPLFLQNLDTSVMATALPSIAGSLEVQVLHLNLAITAYLLSLAVFLPVSGWLSERFGPKRVFCGAIIFFSLGSALCGAAQSLPQLVLFRVLQGIGGAMMVPVGRLILLRSVPPAQMVSAMVWFTVPGAIGRMAGPLFGGAIVTLVSWRWIFLVNIPFGLLGVLMAMRYIDADATAPDPAGLTPFDLLGFVLLAVGLTCLLGALETAGRALVPVAASWGMAGAGLLALWAYYRHGRRRSEPLIDLAILRYPTYRAAVLGGMPLRIAIGASPFLLPLMLQLGFGLSPLKSGLLTVATAIGSLSTRTVVARLIRAVGFRSLLVGATAMTSILYACYGLFRPTTPHVLMFCVMLLGGLCNSMAMVTLNTLGYSEIPRPRMSHATALASMAQQLSVSLGVVMGAALLTLTSLLRGGDAAHLQAGDFSPAFAVVGMMTLLSVLAFARLRKEEGEELRAG